MACRVIRHQTASQTTEHVNFAQQETVILVRQDIVLRGPCLGEDAVNVSKDTNCLARSFAVTPSRSATKDAAQILEDADRDKDTRSQSHKTKDQLLALQERVNARHGNFQINLCLLDLDQEGPDKVAPDSPNKRLSELLLALAVSFEAVPAHDGNLAGFVVPYSLDDLFSRLNDPVEPEISQCAAETRNPVYNVCLAVDQDLEDGGR
ncbi:hypothetical protein MKX08_004154 [Trichoderma sp. CBMAI-0020]|nr:hypothetical protein MKX08_004154 [Trichoderma sp. CBMAI-0020]